MEQMIYSLNLPQLSECILEGVDEKYFKRNNVTHYAGVNPKKIFKPEYQSIKQINWDTVLIFYRKSGDSSPTHTDLMDMTNTTWAINWIYKGVGLMEFWELEDFEKENVQFYQDSQGYSTYRCTPTKLPRLKYFLTPGAYLVNTTKVHRATSFQDRYCVSLRSNIIHLNWNDVVDLFKDMISSDDPKQIIK